MAQVRILGASESVLKCDGCGGTSLPASSTIGWESGPFENFHTCPGCLAADERFLPMLADGWHDAASLAAEFAPGRVHPATCAHWLKSAYLRGLLDRSRDGQDDAYSVAEDRNPPPMRVRDHAPY